VSFSVQITIASDPTWIHKEFVQPGGSQLSKSFKQKARTEPLWLELCALDKKKQWNKLKNSGEYWRKHFPDHGQWETWEGAGQDYLLVQSPGGKTLFYLDDFTRRTGRAAFEKVKHSGGYGTFLRKGSWQLRQMDDDGDPGVWLGMGLKGALSAGAAGKEWWWAIAANTGNPAHVIGLRADGASFGPQLGLGVSVGVVLVTGCPKPSQLWGTELTGLDFALELEENWAAAIKGAAKCEGFLKAMGACLETSAALSVKFDDAAKALSAAHLDYIGAAKTICSGAGVDFTQKNVVFIDLYGKGLRFGVYWSRGWIHPWNTQLVHPVKGFIELILKLREIVTNPRCTKSLDRDPFLQRYLRIYGGEGVKLFND